MSGKSIWDKYQLLVYLVLACSSIILGGISYIFPEGTCKAILINLCSELLAVVVLFSFFYYFIEKEKTRRANEKIFIVIKDDTTEAKFPVPLLRSQFGRNEVLGVVGMIPRKAAFLSGFKIKHTSNPEFLSDVNRISAGDGDSTIYIRCTKEEMMEQFDFPESWKRQAV